MIEFRDITYVFQKHAPALFTLAGILAELPGAALSESDDGIHFRKTGLLIHSAENPSVFARKNGGLLLLFDGVWTTDDMKRWSCINPALTISNLSIAKQKGSGS